MEREAVDFVRRLQALYFEERNIAAVLAEMDENISWIGSGAGEVCRGLAMAKEALAADQREYGGCFKIIWDEYEAVGLSGDVCLVFGQSYAQAEDSAIADIQSRVSAICIRTPQGIRLKHLHLSHPDNDQETGQYYVKRTAISDKARLKTLVAAATAALAERNQELEQLLDNIPGGMYCCFDEPYFTLIHASESFLALFGYQREELDTLLDGQFINMIVPEDRDRVSETVAAQLAVGQTIEVEYRMRHKDGRQLWVLDKGKLVTAADGSKRFYCMLIDITDRRKAQEALRLSLEQHQVIMDQATDIIFTWDINADTLTFSPNWRKKFGYEAIDRQISSRIPLSKNIHPEDMPAFVAIMEAAGAGVSYSETEFRIRDIHGKYHWCRIRATDQYDDQGQPVRSIGVITDIEREKQHTAALMAQAQRDALTGLLNKATIEKSVEKYLAFFDAEHSHGLLIIDLDNFKLINDNFGHFYGDQVLASVADGLRKVFRGTDLIGRIGGDEFLAFMPNITWEQAAEKAKAVLRQMGEIAIGPQEGRLSVSIGIAMYSQDAVDFPGLYQCADKALYYIKHRGKGHYALHQDLDSREAIFDDLRPLTAVNERIDSDCDPGGTGL